MKKFQRPCATNFSQSGSKWKSWSVTQVPRETPAQPTTVKSLTVRPAREITSSSSCPKWTKTVTKTTITRQPKRRILRKKRQVLLLTAQVEELALPPAKLQRKRHRVPRPTLQVDELVLPPVERQKKICCSPLLPPQWAARSLMVERAPIQRKLQPTPVQPDRVGPQPQGCSQLQHHSNQRRRPHCRQPHITQHV